MANYTITNLKQDVEDTAGARTPSVEGRFARKYLDSRDLGISYFRYAPGFRSPVGHRHREQEEVYVVLSGSGRVKLEDEVRDLRQWDVVRVAPEVGRSFEAGADGLELIIAGGVRPEGGDGELIEDFWDE
jgi:mannose-6-phosphate isomerase-like protein (cupin superfamily)